MPLQEGKAIWNESLMTPQEWKDRTKEFPGTSHKNAPPDFFKSEYEWRWRMGAGLTPEEIRVIGHRLDEWRKQLVTN